MAEVRKCIPVILTLEVSAHVLIFSKENEQIAFLEILCEFSIRIHKYLQRILRRYFGWFSFVKMK